MFILIFFCSSYGFFVLYSSETDKAFIINVDSERIYAHQSDIDSKIKFKTIKKKRIVKILTDYRALLEVADIVDIVCDEYAFSLGTRTLLYDPVLAWI